MFKKVFNLAPHLRQGQAAEQQAKSYLEEQGLTTVCENFRCKSGEIDLIMQHADTLVFIEVRLRTNPHFGSGAETVGYSKQQKLIRAAAFYLQKHRLTDKVACRFDIISAARSPQGELFSLEWIQNAFQQQ